MKIMNQERKKTKSIYTKSSTSLPVRPAKIGDKSNTSNKAGSKPIWIIPKVPRSFLTKGVLSRRAQTAEFAYDLSQDERLFSRNYPGPMKELSTEERELQQSGERINYLNTRYEHAPDQKYNFPEATSWRIGWFHSQQISK